MTDHKAEAERLNRKAFAQFSTGREKNVRKERDQLIAAAQVHATLYLAEQTRLQMEQARIGNLMQFAISHADGDEYSVIGAAVREVLGL